MTLAEMRTFVRSALDTDSTDLPDALLDRYLIDGSDRVESFSNSWTFREVDYSLSVVSGTQTYKLRAPTRNAGFTANVARITDIRGTTISLEPRAHDMARNWFTSTVTSGTPRWYSVWADNLYLWPKPASSATYSVTGYRDGIDWVGTSAAPDFPDEFHELIAWWGVSMSYAREGDPGMSGYYADRFNEALNRRSESFLHRGAEQPLVMNSGFLGPRAMRLGRPRFDWE